MGACSDTSDNPTDLRIKCVNRYCEFASNQPLPILAVDEPIYRRLPCFLIATVDKFGRHAGAKSGAPEAHFQAQRV